MKPKVASLIASACGLVVIALCTALPAAADPVVPGQPQPGVMNPDCNIGQPNSQGSTTISISGNTASVLVSNWAFCGESLVVTIHWSDGSSVSGTSASKGLAAGQCISASADIGDADGVYTTQTTGQVCAPSSSGNGGGGGGSGGGGSGGGGSSGGGSGGGGTGGGGGIPPVPPSPVQLTYDDGWTEAEYSNTGQLLWTRSGIGLQQPYGSTFGSASVAIASSVAAPLVTDAPSACKTVDWYESGHSGWFGSLVYRFHTQVHFCWAGGVITQYSASAYPSNVSGTTEQYDGLVTGTSEDWYYAWGGNAKGGHHTKREGDFCNCIAKYGDLGHSYPWVTIDINANGAWIGHDGGGSRSVW